MRLIWAVDHELERVSKKMETGIGLTVAQRMTLLLIGRTPGTYAAELAEQLCLHPGTISGIIQRLERGGMVNRVGDETDARWIRLTLTIAGRAAVRRRSGTFEEAVRRALASTSSADRAAAERLLSTLASQLAIIAEG